MCAGISRIDGSASPGGSEASTPRLSLPAGRPQQTAFASYREAAGTASTGAARNDCGATAASG